MVGDNPTLAAANESTGRRRTAKRTTHRAAASKATPDRRRDPSFPDFPPLRIRARRLPSRSWQQDKVLPDHLFSSKHKSVEDLLKAKIRPPGPPRAEEVEVKSCKAQFGSRICGRSGQGQECGGESAGQGL